MFATEEMFQATAKELATARNTKNAAEREAALLNVVQGVVALSGNSQDFKNKVKELVK